MIDTVEKYMLLILPWAAPCISAMVVPYSLLKLSTTLTLNKAHLLHDFGCSLPSEGTVLKFSQGSLKFHKTLLKSQVSSRFPILQPSGYWLHCFESCDFLEIYIPLSKICPSISMSFCISQNTMLPWLGLSNCGPNVKLTVYMWKLDCTFSHLSNLLCSSSCNIWMVINDWLSLWDPIWTQALKVSDLSTDIVPFLVIYGTYPTSMSWLVLTTTVSVLLLI